MYAGVARMGDRMHRARGPGCRAVIGLALVVDAHAEPTEV